MYMRLAGRRAIEEERPERIGRPERSERPVRPERPGPPERTRRTRRTRREGGGRRRARARALDAAAALLVLAALVAPDEAARLTPGAFARVPIEGILGVALMLILPPRPRRVAAVVAGAALGLLTIVKMADIGFSAVLDRPFHPVFDWSFLGPAFEFVDDSAGRPAALGAVILAVLLAAAVPVVMTLSVVRLSGLVIRHHAPASGAVTVLGSVAVVAAMLGAQLPGMPDDDASVAALAGDRVRQVRSGLRDHKTFAAQAAVDPYRHTPGDRLLTALRGKDVVLAFVESYGRDAIEDPRYARQVGSALDAGSRRLRAAGFASRSAFLTSPTAGGGSTLAHATLLSGLWVDNQRRHHDLEAGDRLTLTKAFRRASWRTVAVMPGNTRPWPQAAFYGYDKVYDRWTLGYQGPRFNWGMPPDQYTLSAFQRFERSRPRDDRGRAPVMAEIPLVSSHAPWTPVPRMTGWKDVGDGSVFNAAPREDYSATAVRTGYRRSIEYSLNALISYAETYGDDDLVVVFLGDHQPAPLITGDGASRDVPITIVARDRAVLDRTAGWGWQDGLKPGPGAPVWPMNAFRDRFLAAFGSTPQAHRATAP